MPLVATARSRHFITARYRGRELGLDHGAEGTPDAHAPGSRVVVALRIPVALIAKATRWCRRSPPAAKRSTVLRLALTEELRLLARRYDRE